MSMAAPAAEDLGTDRILGFIVRMEMIGQAGTLIVRTVT